jgi:hypothetical protein
MSTAGSGSGSGSFFSALGGGAAFGFALPLSAGSEGLAHGGGAAPSVDGEGASPVSGRLVGGVVKLLGVGGPVESAVDGSGGSMSMRFGSTSGVAIVCSDECVCERESEREV